MSPPPPCYSDLALNQTFQQWIALSTNTLPLFLIAEGYPAVQCQFPRHQAHRSPSPTLTPPANSITAHQRLARCSAKVLPIAASTARGLVWKKTPVAALHLVYICWHIQYISLHANISLKHAPTTKSCIYQSSFFFSFNNQHTCQSNFIFFSHAVHSRSSPADTCTPPSQKSRVKKKASKNSAYRRDIQGGEWLTAIQSEWFTSGREIIVTFLSFLNHIFTDSLCVIQSAGHGAVDN